MLPFSVDYGGNTAACQVSPAHTAVTDTNSIQIVTDEDGDFPKGLRPGWGRTAKTTFVLGACWGSGSTTYLEIHSLPSDGVRQWYSGKDEL